MSQERGKFNRILETLLITHIRVHENVILHVHIFLHLYINPMEGRWMSGLLFWGQKLYSPSLSRAKSNGYLIVATFSGSKPSIYIFALGPTLQCPCSKGVVGCLIYLFIHLWPRTEAAKGEGAWEEVFCPSSISAVLSPSCCLSSVLGQSQNNPAIGRVECAVA